MGDGTSIGRVRGLGSSHKGAEHWIAQRYTAIGNLFLGSWLVASVLLLPNLKMATVSDWLSAPLPATGLILFAISVFWHARLGLQVLIEDYVHDEGNKFGALAALNLVAFAATAFAVVCILKISLGGTL